MFSAQTLWLFVVASLVLAFTPGPNWLYLISRTACQGRRAGLVSLAGTSLGLVAHVIAASLGLSAVLTAVPVAYEALRIVGVAYLLWLAWGMLKRNRDGALTPAVAPASDAALFRQGLLTSVTNPKVALFYIALLPQFIDAQLGSALSQGLVLGGIQLLITASVDALVVLIAAQLSAWLASQSVWGSLSRWFMVSVFGALAAWLALDRRST